MEEDRGGSARKNEGGLREAREVDPRGNAEEEKVNGMGCLSLQTKDLECMMEKYEQNWERKPSNPNGEREKAIQNNGDISNLL